MGQRIVVRRLLAEAGPSGGPGFSDVLGVCTSWGADAVTVQTERSGPVRIRVGEIVSGKPVPPRRTVRHRISPQRISEIASALYDDVTTQRLGDWVLRVGEQTRHRRANSLLALSDPPPDLGSTARAAIEFYRRRGRRPLVAVLTGSATERAFLAEGWVPDSDDPPVDFRVGGLAQARRRLADPPAFGVALDTTATVVRASIGGDAEGFAACSGDWVGFRSLWTRPERRRRGLATAVVGRLFDWAAEQGAVSAYLQVLSQNTPAIDFYQRLGLATHHTYRYLAAADRESPS